MRLLLERVLVTVVDGSEQVRLECHWHGGNQTAHTLVRPVARVKALSTYAALIARATELHRAGNGCADDRRDPQSGSLATWPRRLIWVSASLNALASP